MSTGEIFSRNQKFMQSTSNHSGQSKFVDGFRRKSGGGRQRIHSNVTSKILMFDERRHTPIMTQ